MAGWREIETVSLSSTATSIIFNTGLGGYKFFRLTGFIVKGGTNGQVRLTLNNDTGNNYAVQSIEAVSTTVTGERVTAQAHAKLQQFSTIANKHYSYGATVAKPAAGVKAQLVQQAGWNDGANIRLGVIGAEWNNTADLINRIDLISGTGNFAAGTSILLEGLAF